MLPAAPHGPSPDGDVWYPATRVQQGIWVLDRDDLLRPTQLVPTVVEFTGPVDHTALVAAVGRSLSRHPSLRARFRLDVRRRQVEYRTDGPPAEPGFLDAEAEGWTEEEVDNLVRVLCTTPFDLAQDAPARAEVVRLGAERTLLVVTVHHIIFDGVSRGMLLEDVCALYRAAVDGVEPRLSSPPHPASVADGRTPEETATQVAEVVDRLRGAPAEVRLPFARAAHDASEEALLGTTVTTALDPGATAGVMAVAAQEGCTPFMVGVAVLAAALARTGPQRDFLIAFAWPGRDDPATAEVIGMFMTTVVLRVTLGPEDTWRDLLAGVRVSSMEAFVDSDVPLDAVSAALNPDRNALWPPLSPVLVNLDEAPRSVDLTPGTTGRLRPLDPLFVKYDLALFVRLEDTPGGRRLALSLDYPVNVFDADGVQHFLSGLRHSAADLATFPERTVLEESASPTVAAPAVDLDDPAARLELVRSIWREVLNTDEVADDVSFFESGGDSLLLVLLVERLGQDSGREVRTMDLFRSPTVGAQAELIAAADKAGVPTADRDRAALLAAARTQGGATR
ncbi:condensation domain-containing protein [Streptomyces tropicalis]|uniref:Condensation domain-containing protein n=1 Tax=Streptomyces tropicalis TaxID=3034234 RepID=A0ABT6A870_9ACTN|nr:condensation domain-containing protein [Streptomyces tropicalis]MDF3300834.1 condensation domain-containing protein [Streptomyces tropicalis]